MSIPLEEPCKVPDGCLACGRYLEARSPFIPMRGPTPADVLVVAQNPGREEDRVGQVLIGPSGQLVAEAVSHSKLREYKIAYTNAVRCGVSDPTKEQVEYCRPFVQADLEAVDPKLTILTGAIALRSVLGLANITNRRGNLHRSEGRLYLPMFHPAAILRDPRKKQDFLRDFEQAKSILDGETGKTDKLTRFRKRYKTIMTIEEFDAVMDDLEAAPVLAYDSEYGPTADWMNADLRCYGVSFSKAPKHGIFIPVDHAQSPFIGNKHVKERIAHLLRTGSFFVHHAEPDTVVGERCFGVPFHQIKIVFDVMTASIALHGPDTTHRLKALAYADADTGGYHEELEEFRDKNNITDYGDIPLEILGNPYACGDADTTFQLACAYLPRIEETGQERWYNEVLLPSYRLNVEMRRNGLLMDWDEWRKRYEFFINEKKNIYDEALKIPKVAKFAQSVKEQKKPFSLRSNKQMPALLFTVLRIKPSSRVTKTKQAAIDIKAIKEMALQPGLSEQARAMLDLLLKASKINTFLGTFINGPLKNLYPDGYLHPSFHNFVESSRRGSRDPNVQNVPGPGRMGFEGKPEDDPHNIRMLYRARPGYIYVGADWEQFELKLAAAYSRDPTLVAGVNAKKGEDLHSRAAKKYNIPRQPCAKIVNFGGIYGQGWRKLQAEMHEKAGVLWTEAFCKEVIAGLREDYKQLYKTIEQCHKFIRKHGYVITPILGHRRLLPHAVQSNDEGAREKALREGWNHQVQAMGHDLLQIVMDLLQQYIWDEGRRWLMVNDLHDQPLMEVPVEEADEALMVCKTLMEEIPPVVLGEWLNVTLKAEFKKGTHFGNLEEVTL